MRPPGLARLATKPSPTGSETCTKTIGTKSVMRWRAANVGVLVARQNPAPSLQVPLQECSGAQHCPQPRDNELNVTAVCPPKLLEPVLKHFNIGTPVHVACGADRQHADPQHASGCCARPDRPRSHRPPSSVMNSRLFIQSPRRRARAALGGTSRPSALAVPRLITNSYLVGACTGRSPGFSPFKMRST